MPHRTSVEDLTREEGMILTLLNELGPLTRKDIDNELESIPRIFPPQQRKALTTLEQKRLVDRDPKNREFEINNRGMNLIEEFTPEDFPKDSRI